MKTILWIQGLYYLITGIWPLLHMRSFLAVTGPKTDLWLVRTIAGLIVSMSLSLLVAAWTSLSVSNSTLVLSAAATVTFILVDIYYVSKKMISPIYLADAVVEIFILFSLLGTLLCSTR